MISTAARARLVAVLGMVTAMMVGTVVIPANALRAMADGEDWMVDLRPDLGKLQFTPKSQGGRGTCSVFAVCAVAEYEWARSGGEPVRLSEEFLNWARHRAVPSSGDGGFFHMIVAGLQRYGVCAEELMPYQPEFVPELVPSREALADARARRGMQCVWVKKPGSPTGCSEAEFEAIRQALGDGHPVAVGMRWYRGKDCLGEDFLLNMDKVSGTGDGHSIVLVGMREDDSVPGGGAFAVRNHGGEGFGESGYLQLPFEWVKQHSHDAFFLHTGKPGTLRVGANVDGARVSVDGAWTGEAPVSLEDIPAGRYRVRAWAPGHLCVDRLADIKPGETVNVSLNLPAGGPPAPSQVGLRWTHEPSGIEFVSVPLTPDDAASLALQAPVPTGPFWLGRTEVSNSQFKAFTGATGYQPEGSWEYREEAANLPAANVTRDDAQAFCEWLGGRLPEEGEWEWAARGPELRPFPWGVLTDLTRYVGGGTPHAGSPAPVDSFAEGASWCGALHMVGNVSEWCLDVLPEDDAAGCDPFLDTSAAELAPLRGGSYVHGGKACRPTWKYIGKRSGSGELDGFRAAIPGIGDQ